MPLPGGVDPTCHPMACKLYPGLEPVVGFTDDPGVHDPEYKSLRYTVSSVAYAGLTNRELLGGEVLSGPRWRI